MLKKGRNMLKYIAVIAVLGLSGCASAPVKESQDIQTLRNNGTLNPIPEGTPSHEHLWITIEDDK